MKEDNRKNSVLRSDIDIIKDNLNQLVITYQNMDDKINDLSQKIYGNGREGLLERMKGVESKIDNFVENQKEIYNVKKDNSNLLLKISMFILGIMNIFIIIFK